MKRQLIGLALSVSLLGFGPLMAPSQAAVTTFDYITIGTNTIRVVNEDPSTDGGVVAAIGSLVMFNNAGLGELFLKTGISATAWTQLSTSTVTFPITIAQGGTGQTTANAAFNALAPSQTANAGKFLTTDGTNTSWSFVPLTTGVTGVLPIANGGTALSTTPTNGQMLIGNGTGYTLSTLTAGTGITITNGAGTTTITNANGFCPLGSVTTTDATPTTLQTLTTVSNSVQYVKVIITGYRTSGSAGAVGDSFTKKYSLRIKNVAGTVTVSDMSSDFTSQDQSWTISYPVTGTSVNVTVTGAVNNTIDWNSTACSQTSS